MADIKETGKPEAPTPITQAPTKDELRTYLSNCIQDSSVYRDKFKNVWDECEKQIRCKHPAEWDNKKDWQTKIYIPQQSKKSETANAYLSKMLFGSGRFYNIQGVEKQDKERDTALMELIDVLLEKGGFYFENDFILQEGVDIGTAFLKVLAKEKKDGLKFIWRSPYNSLIDPACGHNWQKGKYWIDEYKKDISELVEAARNPESLYYNGREGIEQLLKDGVEQITGKAEQAFMVVKGIDGTSELKIPIEFKEVKLYEFWGMVKIPDKKNPDKYILENRVITVANDKYIIRNNANPYGFIPAVPCRVKPRKYDFYGKGYCENARGLQDLVNSMVNLGFDSLKINSMDIIVVDQTKIDDSSSLEYAPLAMWKVKDINAVKFQRTGVSALSDILNGITLIDQIDQDASGVSRHAQGAPVLSGEGGTESETLGEYQLKLQMIDQRFLKVARFIELDYVVPLIKMIYRIITNPALFSQETADRILGVKEITNPETGEIILQRRLVLAELQGKEMEFDFKAVGLTQFMGKVEMIEKLKSVLKDALSNNVLLGLTKIEELWKRVLQRIEIPDYEEILKTPAEIEKMLSKLQATPAGQILQGPEGGI